VTRRIAVVLSLVALQSVVIFGLTTEAGALSLTGHNTCTSFAGLGKIVPGLSSGGSPSGDKFSFHGVATNCNGLITFKGHTYTVESAKVIGNGSFMGPNTSTCANFEGATPLDTVAIIRMKVKWFLSPHLTVANSNVLYIGTYSAPVASGLMALDLGASATPPTTTTVTGSYGGTLIQNTLMDVAAGGGCPVGPGLAWVNGSLAF